MIKNVGNVDLIYPEKKVRSLNTTKPKKLNKREMKDLFKKHSLSLGFPVGAKNGETVTDWSYHYHFTDYKNSDLKKLETLIKREYKTEFELWDPCLMHSIGVRRKKNG